jgi:hypothetical protein
VKAQRGPDDCPCEPSVRFRTIRSSHGTKDRPTELKVGPISPAPPLGKVQHLQPRFGGAFSCPTRARKLPLSLR